MRKGFKDNKAYTDKFYGGTNNDRGEGVECHRLFIAEIEKILLEK